MDDKYTVVTCPYNSSHRIQRYKLVSHLVKCKKHADTSNKVTCPLNDSHVIDNEHIKKHVTSCPRLSSLIENCVEKQIQMPVINRDMHKTFEDWDKLPEAPSFNPMENSAKKKVIRCVSGMSKSERKQYRINEQIRIANLDGNNITKPILLSTKDMIVTKDEMPIRPPRNTASLLCDTETIQDSSKESTQEFNLNVQTKPSTAHEFRNTFHRTLYNELLSECEPEINQAKDTCISNENQHIKYEDFSDTKNNLIKKLLKISLEDTLSNNSLDSSKTLMRDNIRNVSERDRNLPIFNQNLRAKIEEQRNHKSINEVDISSIASNSKKTDEFFENNDKDDERKNEKFYFNLEESLRMKRKLSDSVKHLNTYQNLDITQKSKTKENTEQFNYMHKAKSFSDNPRCAANFTKIMPSKYKEQLKNHESNDVLDNGSGKCYKLKTPQDFCQRNDILPSTYNSTYVHDKRFLSGMDDSNINPGVSRWLEE